MTRDQVDRYLTEVSNRRKGGRMGDSLQSSIETVGVLIAYTLADWFEVYEQRTRPSEDT
jgi:hypothetical protein